MKSADERRDIKNGTREQRINYCYHDNGIFHVQIKSPDEKGKKDEQKYMTSSVVRL
jgi:hypothetical protein